MKIKIVLVFLTFFAFPLFGSKSSKVLTFVEYRDLCEVSRSVLKKYNYEIRSLLLSEEDKFKKEFKKKAKRFKKDFYRSSRVVLKKKQKVA